MTPPTVSAGGAGTAVITVEASGKYAYATSGESGWGNSSIAQFTIDQTTGALTLMNNPTVQTSGIDQVAWSPLGKSHPSETGTCATLGLTGAEIACLCRRAAMCCCKGASSGGSPRCVATFWIARGLKSD